jgi:hypothetical protein
MNMINTSEKAILRKELLTACFLKQSALINDFKTRIETLLASEGLGNEEAYDNNQLSHSSQRAEEVNALNQALEFANEELKILQHLATQTNVTHIQVEAGSIVTTKNIKFFVSVSIEQFDVYGQVYVGLSTKSPLFLSMKGKRKGQKFAYKGTPYQIIDIF